MKFTSLLLAATQVLAQDYVFKFASDIDLQKFMASMLSAEQFDNKLLYSFLAIQDQIYDSTKVVKVLI